MGKITMEVNRRNFIKFLVGGVAGIHISPLPWKLTDDIAIWTQNWPWVPVPPEGEFTKSKSICSLCPGGCGIELRKVDTRAVKIEGRTDYPVNPGGICPLGMGGLQLLYNESFRFTGPMKRVGARGSGQFEGIGWDEALDTLAARIIDLRKKGTPEALAAVDGNRRESTMSLMIERLLMAVGSPNYVRTPSVEDTYAMANFLMQGTRGPMAYDLENADYILSFATGLIEGWGAPGRVINAWGMWHADSSERKAKVVQIESRASNTASKADQWVAVRPGTEAALALGLAHVLVKDRLYNAEFVDNYCFGFHDWKSAKGKDHVGFKTLVLQKYSPEQVAEITGVEPGRIVSLAREFVKASAPLAVCGRGKGYQNSSVYEAMAVQSLNALAGVINKAGGVLVHDAFPLSALPEVEEDDVARAGLQKPRLDEAGTGKYPFSDSLINNLANVVTSGNGQPVDTLLVFSSNPAFTLPDGGTFRRALGKIPFTVSFSPFRDETSYMADLVLPDHTYLEKMEEVLWPTGLQYPFYGLSAPGVSPVYDTKHNGDTILELAERIGGSVKGSFPWRGFEDVLKVRVKGLYESGGGLVTYQDSPPVWERMKGKEGIKPDYQSLDDMWGKMKSSGLWYRPAHAFEGWDRVFKTPSKKFEFFSTRIQLAVENRTGEVSAQKALEEMGVKAQGDEAFMPHYEPASPVAKREVFPLVMVPYEIINLASGWIPQPPFLNKTLFDHQLLKEESFAEMNPKTAAEYRLKEGDRVWIESPAGKVLARVHLYGGAMPGIVYLPLGFGHTAYDEFLRGKGVNPNDIVHAGKDPLSGHPAWWNTPVKLMRA